MEVRVAMAEDGESGSYLGKQESPGAVLLRSMFDTAARVNATDEVAADVLASRVGARFTNEAALQAGAAAMTQASNGLVRALSGEDLASLVFGVTVTGTLLDSAGRLVLPEGGGTEGGDGGSVDPSDRAA